MIKKHWMSICLVLIFFTTAGIFYYFYPHTDTNSHLPIPSEISSVSTFDTKEKSGTSMIIDPSIRTGSTNTPTKTHSGFIFQKPNTDWKERDVTLNDGRTLHYVFGEGNPKEVAPKREDFKDGTSSEEYFHSGIVRSKTEKTLKDFLSNPMLVTALNKCGSLIKADPYSQSDIERNFPNSLSTTDFSLESILSVDLETGRKSIDWSRFDPLNVLFQIRNYTLSGNRENLLASQCLSGNEIADFDLLMDQFLAVGNSFINDSPENREEVF